MKKWFMRSGFEDETLTDLFISYLRQPGTIFALHVSDITNKLELIPVEATETLASFPVGHFSHFCVLKFHRISHVAIFQQSQGVYFEVCVFNQEGEAKAEIPEQAVVFPILESGKFSLGTYFSFIKFRKYSNFLGVF